MRWRLHSTREFARLASDWDSLASRSGSAAFLDSRFIAPLLAEFANGSESLVVCNDSEGVCAMALLERVGRGRWQTFQPSQLPLGPWIALPGADVGALAARLLPSLPGFALQLGLTQLDPQAGDRPRDAGAVATLDYVRTAWIELDGDFAAYWESRGKNLRTNMRKQRRKLQAEGIAPRLEILTRSEDMAEAIESYGHLESAGWKSALGTAIAADNAQGRFYQAMLANFCATGAGRVYRYWFGDQIVAIDLCIERSDTLVVLKTTYDETHRQLSPAFLMREDALRTIFEEGRIRRVEFYGKLMDWHSHWTRDERMLYHLNCYRWAWLRKAQAWRRKAHATETASAPTSSPTESAPVPPA